MPCSAWCGIMGWASPSGLAHVQPYGYLWLYPNSYGASAAASLVDEMSGASGE